MTSRARQEYEQPRSQGPLFSSLEKVPWLRLVTCLCMQIKWPWGRRWRRDLFERACTFPNRIWDWLKNNRRNNDTIAMSPKTIEASTSFPGSSLFLPRESTLVAAGHVSARFLQIPEMWLKGGAGKLKFVSARLPTEPSRGVQFVTLPLWIGKNHSEGIDTFDIGVQCVAFSWIFPRR